MVVTHTYFPYGHGVPSFVLDCTVTLAWMLPTLRDWYSTQVLGKLPATKPVVPSTWIAHVGDALRLAEQAGILTPVQAAGKLVTLRGYPVLFDDQTDFRLWYEILDLARTHSLSVYDAAYLELSLRLNLPLATIDANLTRAVANAGVTIFTP